MISFISEKNYFKMSIIDIINIHVYMILLIYMYNCNRDTARILKLVEIRGFIRVNLD